MSTYNWSKSPDNLGGTAYSDSETLHRSCNIDSFKQTPGRVLAQSVKQIENTAQITKCKDRILCDMVGILRKDRI